MAWKITGNEISHHVHTGFILALVSSACLAQKHMVLENTAKGKKIVLEEGDRVRVYFQADTVLHKRYRPTGYRNKDKRVSYSDGRITEYTENGFKLKPASKFPRNVFKKNKDTLTIRLEQVIAVNKYSNSVAITISALPRIGLRGAVLVGSLLIDMPVYVFIGANLRTFVVEPYVRKGIQSIAAPLRTIQGEEVKWRLYFEEDGKKMILSN